MNSKLNYDTNTKYLKGYKYKLYPTETQKVYLEKCLNTNKYVYNWGLSIEKEQYEKYCKAKEENQLDIPYGFINKIDLFKLLTIKRKETEWMKDIPNTTARSGIIDLNNAFNRFFKGISNYPKFKSKHKLRNPHFHTRKDRMFFDKCNLKIEGCKEYIDLKVDTNFTKNDRNIFINPVISKDNIGNYFISFSILEDKPVLNSKEYSEVIGIDLNKRNYFALSNGKIYKSDIKKIKHLQKSSRLAQSKCYNDYLNRVKELKKQEKTNPDISIYDIPMSNRAKKRKYKYNKRLKKLSNYVENSIHNITKEIVMTNPKGIVMEDLKVNDIESNHYIASEIYDYCFGKCKQIMREKAEKYNIPFKLAPSNFPSSSICSNCGNIRKININTRNYYCPNCGLKINRDINAAKNLAMLFDTL